MISRSKKIILSAVLFVNIATPVLADTVTVTSFTSLNNSSSDSTYKHDEEYLKKVASKVSVYSQITNFDLKSEYKNIQGYDTKVSWLLENDILSKDVTISSTAYSVKTHSIPNIVDMDSDTEISRSDYLMALCKAAFGVQESKPVVINTKADQLLKTVGKGSNKTTYNYSEGDYSVYTSPNVYELYFTTLLDKGLISINDFKDINFRQQYESLKTDNKPDWYYTNLSVLNTKNGISEVLGSTLLLSKVGNVVTTTYKKPNYFIDESMTKLDALKYIESIMRLTESDMTETESKIITYKYGVDYIRKVDPDSQKTVMYLLAKGILDFDNDNELSNLYDNLDADFFYTLIYRFANKSARKNFSEVQLTDSDNYWLKQDMYEATVSFYTGYSGIDADVQSYESLGASTEDEALNILKSRTLVYNDKNYPKWLVTMSFQMKDGDQVLDYRYRGKNVHSLTKDSFDEISEVSNKTEYTKIIFSIQAPNSKAALAIVQSKISLESGNQSYVGKYDAVAKISKDGSDKTYYYVPKSALQSLGKNGRDNQPEIIAIDDKYLINTRTNTTCVLLDDQNKALIGNEVMDTGGNMVWGEQGEVYYNLKILRRLMSNSYLDDLDESKIIQEPLYSTNTVKFLDEKSQVVGDIKAANSSTAFDSTLINYYSDVRTTSLNNFNKDNSKKTDKYAVSMLHTSKGLNCLYKKIKESNDKRGDIYMVVEWEFAIPYESLGFNNSLSQYLDVTKLDAYLSNPSVEDMHNFLYNRPEEAELQKWWDSNIGLSNAVCNYFYGTKGLSYSSSGYLVPKITFLVKGKGTKGETRLTEDEINAIFKEMPFTDEYKSKYLKGSSIYKSLFDIKAGNDFYSKMAASRTCSSLLGRKVGDSGTWEFRYYVIDKTQVVYKTVLNEEYKGDVLDKNMAITKDNGVVGLTMVTRGENTSEKYTLEAQKYYKVNGRIYRCLGEETINGTTYYELEYAQGAFDLKLTSSSNVSTYTFSGEGYSSIEEWYKKFVLKGFSSENAYMDFSWDYSVGKGDLGQVVSGYKYVVSAKSFDPGSKLVESMQTGPNIVLTKVDNAHKSTKWEIDYPMQTETIRVIPKIYIQKFGYKKTDTSNKKLKRYGSKESKSVTELVNESTVSCFFRDNIATVGVADGVKDSIVYQNYEAVPTSKLPSGAKVIIGDMTFTVKGGKLLSSPIENATVVNQMLVGGITSDNLKTCIASMFDGLNVSVIENGKPVGADTLLAYVPSTSSGKLSIGLGTYKDKITSDTLRVLCKQSNETTIKSSSGTKVYEQGDSFNSFVFSIKFNSKVRFKPLNADKTLFTLVSAVQGYGDGNLSDVPFFTTSLSYDWDTEIYGKIGTNKYIPATDYLSLFDKIKQSYEDARRRDIKGLLCLFIQNVLSYMIVMNLLCNALKSQTVISHILSRLNSPTRDSGKGVDLLKFFSLGLVSIEDESSIFKTIGVTGILALVYVVFMNIMY